MKYEPSWQARYRIIRVLWLLVTISLAALVSHALKSGRPFFWSEATPILSFGLFWLSCFFSCLLARRRAIEERFAQVAVSGVPGRRQASFLWQGVLILFPVAAMAGFGFWAILQERNAVEQDARQRAQDILHAFPVDFGQRIANCLSQFEMDKDGWNSYLDVAVASWPKSDRRRQWLADTNEAQSISHSLGNLRKSYPDQPGGPFPPLSFYLNRDGYPTSTHLAPPRPAPWLLTMSAGQYQAWTALQTAVNASASSSNMDSLFDAFSQTQPSTSALNCATFLRLRATSATRPANEAIHQLLQFSGRDYTEVSDSGIPLATLALAESLKRALADHVAPTEEIWTCLRAEATSPTVLTPRLLDEADRLVAGDAPLSAAVAAMRIFLAEKIEENQLTEAVEQTAGGNDLSTTNLWIETMGQHWFCISSPIEMRSQSTVSDRHVTKIETNTIVRCYPETMIARGFANWFQSAKIILPDYFGMSLELEGRPVILPSPWGKQESGATNGTILAEANLQMSERAGMREADPITGVTHDVFFEAMPSHPHFTLQIRLTDRDLLYARQRQQQEIFEALVGFSAAAALIGFLAAHRAFRRQQELNVLKSNFVSSVSHELRAPIAAVRLMAENLESGKVPAADKQHEYFKFIVQECRRLSSLIENVLDFSRIEQGRKQYELEPTDLAALAQTTVTLMEPYAREKGVELRLEPMRFTPASKLELNLDGRAMQQALVNLLDNAIKHSGKGEVVTMGLERINKSPPVIHLSVADHGPGIPEEEHEKIFERFYRRGSELRRETQGIGIGLSLVKHIVEAHQGRVLVESTVGNGSRFIIELPAREKVE